MKRRSVYRICHASILSLFYLFYFNCYTFAQGSTLSGKVADKNGHPLNYATVQVKGANRGAKTNESGSFQLQLPGNEPVILVISYTGYSTKEIHIDPTRQPGTINVQLEEKADQMDEVIVTGVFDKRKRMEASVAITTLSSQQLSKLAPVSAADILKNVPGIYVNSSLGEVRNTVYSRGVSVGSNDGASGYYYVSMQEDGLPVTNTTYNNYGPDYFTRVDATLGRLEAVRGGTASILGANAPGGIFNYVMKEGGTKTEGEVRTKYGLQGNGKNSFYRADVNVGGPLGHNWFYDWGGFYRYDQGNRYPGYPMNKGGQFRGNVVRRYNTGSLKIYAKYLDDHNGWFEFTPTVSFSDPKPAPGFSERSSVLIPAVKQLFPVNGGVNGTDIYSSDNLIHSIDKSVGATWEQRLGSGWTLNNAIRYSAKSSSWNTTGVVYPLAFDDLMTYAILGMLGRPGTYSFRSTTSSKELMSVTSYSGYDFNVNHSELPGKDVSPNSLFLEPLLYKTNHVKELLNQFSLTKKLKRMSFTIGGFYGYSRVHRRDGSAGAGFGTIQDRPELVNVTLTAPDGAIYHVTNGNGTTMGGTVNLNEATQTQAAVFLGHNWQLSNAFNLDWGMRYESVKIKGHNTPAVTVQDTTGGLDRDPLTMYDNSYGSLGAILPFIKTINTFSFSAGWNYKIGDLVAVYGRYSLGNKAPDLDMYFAANTEFTNKTLRPQEQRVQQLEMGVKVKTSHLNLFVTPFYSVLSNVANVQVFQNVDQTSYNAPATYARIRTLGVETEAEYTINEHFKVRAVLTLQRSRATDYTVWLARNPGVADDTLVSYSGNETDNAARSMINITPSYNTGRFYAQLNWSFMGKRQANVANAFLLPSFSQFNFATGYDISSHLQLSFNVNNILNKYGVMSWSRPGTLLTAIDRQGFTKEMYETAVKNNTPYSTISIPARSYYLTATFRF